MSNFAYSAIYSAFRNGALSTHSAFYSAEGQISTAEQYNAMIEAVGRTAVSKGQANAIADVSITSVCLLNPHVEAPTVNEACTNRDEESTNRGNEFNYSPEYVEKLEAAFSNLYHVLDLGSPSEEVALVLGDHQKLYTHLLKT